MNLNRCIARLNLIIFFTFAITPPTFSKDLKGTISRSPQSAPKSLRPCEINFLKLVNGNLPAEITGNNKINLWDQLFEPDALAEQISKIVSRPQRLKALEELVSLVDRDKVFTDNLSELVTLLYENKAINAAEIRKLFLTREFEHARFFWSDKTKALTSQINISQEKLDVVEKLLAQSNLAKSRASEYRDILLQSSRTAEELEFAISSGMVLHNSDKHLLQFRQYFDFMNVMQDHKIKKALQAIEEIYDFGFRHSSLSISAVLPPHKQFLIQRSKTIAYEQKRFKKLLKEFKLAEKGRLSEELSVLAERERRGEIISERELKKLERKLEEIEIPTSLVKRAKLQAFGEREIYRKLLNGCSGGNNPRVEKAAKKFKRFKYALSLTTTPVFYVLKNYDKMDKDPYFWEKLGYEVTTGFAFTFVANKIITNSSTSFFRKYMEGYIKFGLMDGFINGIGFEQMFGAHEHIRYIQKLYRSEIPESDLDRELKELMESPTFEQDVKELITYLEEQSKKLNLKNYLEKLFNYGAYNSAGENYVISKEDLESDEAKEVMMELLAERMYLKNMGSWPIFQSGNSGADRWMFFRTRNLVWDLKGIAFNLAIFQVMCREPFGKVGSWLAVLSMVVGDSLLSGNLTYGLRREAINQ